MSRIAVIVTSRLREPESGRDEFLALSEATQAWMQAQPGFLRYELFEGNGAWIDTMLWADATAAEAGNRAFSATEIAQRFARIVEPDFHAFMGAATPL